jgi:hypothetical protein
MSYDEKFSDKIDLTDNIGYRADDNNSELDKIFAKDKITTESRKSKNSRESRKTNRSKSKRQDTKNSNSEKKTNQYEQIESEDISLSQLEVMANKKKLNKVDNENVEDSEGLKKQDSFNISEANTVTQVTKNSKTKYKHKTSRTRKDNTSFLSSETDTEELRRRKKKMISKENKDENIRKEKSEFLYKFNKVNTNGKWSSLNLDMNNSLEEIKNEYQRVSSAIQNERSVAFLKRMLLLGVQGVEMLNTKFDPLGVDLDGWSESMGYSLENQEYDEVLAELYEKYKGKGQMSPEMKLLFMIISSATMFTVTKRLTNMESSSGLGNLIGSLMGKGKQQTQKQPEVPQTSYPQTNYRDNADELVDLTTQSSSEDFTPAKLRGPQTGMGNFGGENDSVDIRSILEKMNSHQKVNNNVESEYKGENSEDILKEVDMNTSKRKRGRPRKNKPKNMSLNL